MSFCITSLTRLVRGETTQGCPVPQAESRVQNCCMNSSTIQVLGSVPLLFLTSVQREHNTQWNLNAFATSAPVAHVSSSQRWDGITAWAHFPSSQHFFLFPITARGWRVLRDTQIREAAFNTLTFHTGWRAAPQIFTQHAYVVNSSASQQAQDFFHLLEWS